MIIAEQETCTRRVLREPSVSENTALDDSLLSWTEAYGLCGCVPPFSLEFGREVHVYRRQTYTTSAGQFSAILNAGFAQTLELFF
jgi:hypothetical protein